MTIYDPQYYIEGVLNRNRLVLARTITLIESSLPAHQEVARIIIDRLLPSTGKAVRLGITGVPGAGKSTFIESFGTMLTGLGHRLAVLAIDPSSTRSGGSILGDKTRMEKLAVNDRAFIRPSPSRGTLGGVARKTREAMLVCEAAGYDVVIIETVGVGQSEITVASMVDFFLILMIAGAGDELQGIKKGVLEVADAIVINKADGDNVIRAEMAQKDYQAALHLLMHNDPVWSPPVLTCSSLEMKGWRRSGRLLPIIAARSPTPICLKRKGRVSHLSGWPFSSTMDCGSGSTVTRRLKPSCRSSGRRSRRADCHRRPPPTSCSVSSGSSRNSRKLTGLNPDHLLFLIPPGVCYVIVGYPRDFSRDQPFADILDLAGRNPGIDARCIHLRTLSDDRPRRNDGIAPDHTVVHDDGPHADQDIIEDGAAMDDGIVADRHIIADIGRRFLIGAVDDGPVLDIHLVAHPDIMHIPPDHRIIPDTALLTHDHVPDDNGRLSEKAAFTVLWSLAVEFPDNHKITAL
jgi:LAO/AO transport system kinase